MIVEYNTTLSYENVNKSTHLFRVICVSAGFGRCSVAVTIVLAQNEIQTIHDALRIDQCKCSQ